MIAGRSILDSSNVQNAINQSALLRAQSVSLKTAIVKVYERLTALHARAKDPRAKVSILGQQAGEQSMPRLWQWRFVADYKKRIFCIDDDADTCDLMKFYIEREGYKFIAASTMAEGANRIRTEHFDLYIIDNQLPDGSGIDLARQIRYHNLKTPILFHSGDAYSTHIQQAIEAAGPICTYITKPSDPDQVITTIQTLIAESENKQKSDWRIIRRDAV